MRDSEVSLTALGAFVPFPSALLDEEMPRLKDTEWRVLCVIVRQTIGWRSGAGRKRRDWISQRQLMKRTGRASAAVSAALDALVKRNLIECHAASGEPLLSPSLRRAHRGRVYFSLAPDLLRNEESSRAPRLRDPEVPPSPRPYRLFTGWSRAEAVARVHYTTPSASEPSSDNSA